MSPPAAHPAPVSWAVLCWVCVVAAVLFGVLASLTVAAHGVPPPWDAEAHRWALSHRTPGLTDVAIVVTTSGTGWAAYALAAAAGALADRTRRWRGAVIGVTVLAAGQALRITAATAISRDRPSSADWAWKADGPAMPSGHSTTSAIVAVLLTVAFARVIRGGARRWVCPLPAVWALAVGASRVYLGMHWPTDVLAGWLLAAAWTAPLGALDLALGRTHHHHPALMNANPPQGDDS